MKSDCIKMAYDVIRIDKSLKAKILRKAEKLSESKKKKKKNGENRSNA